MTADIRSLVGAYVLDAVDGWERAAAERHLRECDECRAEAAEWRETAARLADGAWSVPPPGLRDAVLAAVATTRQAPAEVPRRLPRAREAQVQGVLGAADVVWREQP